MDELKDASIHHTAMKIANAIKSMKGYDSLLKGVQELVCSPNVDKNDFRHTLEDAIKNAGLETDIRNIVFHLLRSTHKPEVKSSFSINGNDPLSYLKRSAVQWDRRVRKSLNAICVEVKMPFFGQQRSATEREELSSKWEALSNCSTDLFPAVADFSSYRPVYAPKDLLDVLLCLKGPFVKPAVVISENSGGASGSTVEASSTANNISAAEMLPKWEYSHIDLPVKSYADMRACLIELLRSDIYNTTLDLSYQCERVLASKHSPVCQLLLKKGNTPPPYRGTLWTYVLGSAVTLHDVEHWHKLKNCVLLTEHVVDKLVFKDVQLTASNDDQYFVFEDVLYQIMLCFSRDTEIAKLITFESYPVKGKNYEGPPSGVVPYHGICMFAAPFCYLYDSPMHLYFTFRAFYIRYCHRLTTINTHPQGIVSLCLMFERMLQTHEPDLWSHFRELQIQPLRVVFKWLMRAFSGHLQPEQLLILWDLVLGYDSLEILAFFSLTILSFRKESLIQVHTLDTIESVLADLSSVKVLPLLQLALSREQPID